MITREELRKLAALCYIDVGEEELIALTQDMQNMMEFADPINELSVENNDFDNIHGLVNVLREDVMRPSYDRETILKGAGGGEKGYIKIKGRLL